MSDFDGIPCPPSLKKPISFEPGGPAVGPAAPGTIWEVESPTGELLLFLVVERFDRTGDADELPFDFLRAVPVTNHLELQSPGDAIVQPKRRGALLLAHVALEGPVLSASLRRLIDEVDDESMVAVRAERARLRSVTVASERQAEVVRAFRETLHDQFGPVFFAWWDEVEQLTAGQAAEKRSNRTDMQPGLTLLFRRAMEEQKQLRVAAAADTSAGPASAALANARFVVADDPTVRVAVKVASASAADECHLTVEVVGKPENVRHYSGVEVAFADNSALHVALTAGWGRGELSAVRISQIISLVLLTTGDARRLVQWQDRP